MRDACRPARTPSNQPPVRVAPLGELNAYVVYEHELDILAHGSPGSNLLNISYALLPFAGAFVIALLGTDIPSDRVFAVFVLTALVSGVAGALCLVLGVISYRSNRVLVDEIKNRMPPPASPAPAPSSSG